VVVTNDLPRTNSATFTNSLTSAQDAEVAAVEAVLARHSDVYQTWLFEFSSCKATYHVKM